MKIVHEAHAGGPTTETFAVNLGATQYLLFYVLGDLLSFVIGVRASGLLLTTGYLVGMVAATYALLRSLGRDPRLSLLVVPLLTNTQFLIGLLQFIIGIPLMLWGWSLAIDHWRDGKRRYAIALAVVAILVFYSHVVVFGVFCIGLALVAPLRSPRAMIQGALPVLPAALVFLWWAFFTESGDFVRNAATSGVENKDLWPFWASLQRLYSIAFDTYPDSADEKLFAGVVAIATALAVLARGGDEKRTRPVVSTARWMLIPLACLVLYFRSEGTNGFLGHIRDRFALIAAFTIVPALRMPTGLRGHLGTIAMVVASLMTAETFEYHCEHFEREDVGDFRQALDRIPAGKRVAGLMFDSESKYFSQNPLLHYTSYYLVEKHGAYEFSFAGYPHWPLSYRPHKDPLGASPPTFLWEWQPWRVSPREELAASYDYVITRGASAFDPPDDLFTRVWQGTRWAVWERRAP